MSGGVKPTKTLRAKAAFMKVIADILALAEHLVHLLFFLMTSKKYIAVKKKEINIFLLNLLISILI